VNITNQVEGAVGQGLSELNHAPSLYPAEDGVTD
jgi:hypothetical protein